ncbi:MAG: hypothetical protein ACPGO5_02045 [Patescibacteria group bacterium]
MGLFEYAQEIMYLSFALGALLIAGAFTWLVATVIKIVRDIQVVVDKTKTAVTMLHDVSAVAKEKISDFSTQFNVVTTGVGAILKWIDNRNSNHAPTRDKEDTESEE